ncbi:Alpha/Beta hydrolase protein [Aspergillus ambiguus]|uniref:putative alkaline lipase n=1 Tax=Aspergillus ambiguus TaxID=176160 RepID=UPI003CCD2EE7
MLSSLILFAALAGLGAAVPAADKRSTAAPSAFADLQRAAKLSSAAYTGCLGKAFDITITKQLNSIIDDTQGFIGYSTERKTIAVVMRGSTTVTDILNDINTVMVTPKFSGVNFPSGVQIMSGLNTPWGAVHDQVIQEVSALIEKYPDYTLESTGHSLGGALTYLSYIALAQNFPDKEIHSNALAAFPIGNQAFADFGNAQHGTLWRGNNVADGNMYVTIPYNLVHYGTEYYSYGTQISCLKCSGDRDLTCSAGNAMVGVTAGHFQSFGIALGAAGCISLL